MYTRHHSVVVAVVLSGLALSACSREIHADDTKESPAVVTEIEDSDLSEVALTERAVERVGLEMGEVGEASGTKTVPYAAVVYDQDGAAWVYTSPEQRIYVRSAITISEITDDTALLTDGPDVGTAVVTRGTALLFGAEQGIGY